MLAPMRPERNAAVDQVAAMWVAAVGAVAEVRAAALAAAAVVSAAAARRAVGDGTKHA